MPAKLPTQVGWVNGKRKRVLNRKCHYKGHSPALRASFSTAKLPNLRHLWRIFAFPAALSTKSVALRDRPIASGFTHFSSASLGPWEAAQNLVSHLSHSAPCCPVLNGETAKISQNHESPQMLVQNSKKNTHYDFRYRLRIDTTRQLKPAEADVHWREPPSLPTSAARDYNHHAQSGTRSRRVHPDECELV